MDDRTIPRGIATADGGPVEIHFDGACEGGRGGTIATYGFTVRGAALAHDGRGLALPPFHERATNNVAEYAAAIASLEWLRGRGYSGAVVLLGDSQLVVRQMNGEYEVRSDHLRPYHERLRQLLAGFSRAEIRWVPREENVEADALSQRALAEARADAGRLRGRAGQSDEAPG